jgi:hypothetical protein
LLIVGNNQCRIGPIMREERCEEAISLEPVKINAIQRTTGSQYFKNVRLLSTAHRKQGWQQTGN